MSRLAAVLLVLVLTAPNPLAAQTAAPAGQLVPGARVRVTQAGAKPRTGIVVAQTADTLRVRWPDFSSPDALPVASISRLEVSTGRHRRVLKGMGYGAAAGIAVGGIIGAVSYEPCDSTEFLGCLLAPESRTQSAAWGGMVIGTLGLVVGTLAGIPSREGWQQVSLAERRVSVAIRPGAHTTRLGVALRF